MFGTMLQGAPEVGRPGARRERAGSHQVKQQQHQRSLLVARSLATITTILALLVLVSSAVEARYIHSTYRITPAVYDGQQLPRLQAESTVVVGPDGPELARRQDYEGDEADGDGDEADGDDDQRAAASHRNQDNGGGGGGDGGNSGDSYGDNEPDGPYEETPAEQDGQADLERFFDDHLGASDRDGMDKENLPTNLVATRSNAPPDLMSPQASQLTPNDLPPVLLAAILPPVQNPLVGSARTMAISSEPNERLSSAPTVQTSFIRLPDEKMIITREVTAARNSPRGPLKIDSDPEDISNLAPGHSNISQQAGAPLPITSPFSSQLFGLRISPTEPLPGLTPPGGSSPAASEAPRARKGVISREGEDSEPVYVTSETNKPFEIDALGGFDPEADFDDAARELQVDVGDGPPRRTALKRRGAGQQHEKINGRPSGKLPAPSQMTDEQQQNLREIIFGEPDSDKMYEDASETDEVTFDHDDPYQTDLEAEMRQQELEKLRASLQAARQTNDQPRDRADGMNVVVDDGLNGNQAQADDRAATNADADDDDIDSDIDNEYKPEPTRQRDSIAGAAASVAPRGAAGGDTDDEGAWVNDGADEMEVPSQSHQNLVLDRAEQRNKAAADAEAEAAAAREQVAGEPNDEQDPDGGGGGNDGGSNESGQTNEDGTENIRMPNADYLKNDFIEDDSGYAAA